MVFSKFALADIFEWQDEKGVTHFSERPQVNAYLVNIKPRYHFYNIKSVYDGDTIQLEDGRKVRLLGINAPEIQHQGKSAEVGGYEAKKYLIGELYQKKVRLEVGIEKLDKYGRTLAHLFTEEKKHINLQLVKAGLAFVNIYPMELAYADELVKAEQQAERKKVGIWGKAEYSVMPVNNIAEEGRSGWIRLMGKVIGVRKTAKSVYLLFSSSTFEVRIEKQWLDLFPDTDGYIGKSVEVRGWLKKNNGHWSMLVRHPSAIRV